MNMNKRKAVFYSFRRCPYAMRARLALDVSGLEIEHREILLKDKPKEMLDASPKGTVPVLVLPDGTVLEESIDIMRYALGKHDPEGWLEGDVKKTNELIALNDGMFKHNLDRYKYPSRYPDEDCTGCFDVCVSILKKYETSLTQSAFLLGEKATLVDTALAPFIRQFSKVEPERFDALKIPKLQNWLTAFLESPRFKRIMEKHKLWRASP